MMMNFVSAGDYMRRDSEYYIEDMTSDHLALLLIIDSMYNQIRKTNMFSLGDIHYMMNASRAVHKKIKSNLEDLVSWGVITITNDVDVSTIGKNTMVECTVSRINSYTKISADLIGEVLGSDLQYNDKVNAVGVIYTLESVRNNKHKHSFPSLKMIEQTTELSIPTILKTIDSLESMGLLAIGNLGVQQDEAGKIRRSNNIYVLADKGDMSTILDNALSVRAETQDIDYKGNLRGISSVDKPVDNSIDVDNNEDIDDVVVDNLPDDSPADDLQSIEVERKDDVVASTVAEEVVDNNKANGLMAQLDYMNS